LTSGKLLPGTNPFGGPGFAGLWHGWRGRRVESLTTGDLEASYVARRAGPLRSLDALPYGIPIFIDDDNAERRAWIDRFFQLGRSVRSSLSLFDRPKSLYTGVFWQEQMRSVVLLDAQWESRVDGDIKRRSRRAQSEGWHVGTPDDSTWPRLQASILETDLRHAADARFDYLFIKQLHDALAESDQLLITIAQRDHTVGGVNVVLRSAGYEISWLLFATDAARADGVVPYLWFDWLLGCAGRNATCADMGASPTQSVQRFKATFGARLLPYYTGTRRWNLTGGH
jgi:hypothetical protein